MSSRTSPGSRSTRGSSTWRAEIIVVAHGADKAAILAEVLGPERDERRWPAQLARRAGATWILDEAAASALGR